MRARCSFAREKWSIRLLLFRSKNGCTCTHEGPFREGSAPGDWQPRHSTPLSTHRGFKNAANCQLRELGALDPSNKRPNRPRYVYSACERVGLDPRTLRTTISPFLPRCGELAKGYFPVVQFFADAT